MVNLTTNSPIYIRLVLAFLEFLSKVRFPPGAEAGMMETVLQSLKEIFQIDIQYLVNAGLISSSSLNGATETVAPKTVALNMPSQSSRDQSIGLSLEELFPEFYIAVAGYGFFESKFGEDYEKRRTRAEKIFEECEEVLVLMSTEDQTYSREDLALALKVRGNLATHKESYYEATELYSCAIAVCPHSAGNFCSRAAALTKIHRFQEAADDCYTAIRLNPNCVDAYFYLGCAFYEQGNYVNAMHEGFIKALQLDPANLAALSHLQLTKCKLPQNFEWMEEQIKLLGNLSIIPKSTSYPAWERTVLRFQGFVEGATAFGRWNSVEEVKESNDLDTINAADYVGLFAGLPLRPQ